MLLVLTDGFAYDEGYELAYGEGDVRRALREARERGVACVCLNVAARDDATLARLYGEAAYAAVPDVERVVPALRRLLRSALLHAQRGRPRAPRVR